MRLSERTPLIAVLLLSCAVAVGLTVWYLNVRQEVQTQHALEQTRAAFERLEKERAGSAANSDNAGRSAPEVPGGASTSSAAVTPPRQIETTTAAGRSAGDARSSASGAQSSGASGPAGTREIYFLLSILMLITLVALGVAGSSYRLVQRERRRRMEDGDLDRNVAHERGATFRSSPITIIDAEAVKEVTPEEAVPEPAPPPETPQTPPARDEHWTRALQQTPLAVVLADAAGRITDVNDTFTRMTGYAKRELPNLESWLLKGRRVRPDELSGAMDALGKTFASPGTAASETTVWTRTGEPRQWLVYYAALTSESRENAWALLGADITDRVNAQHVLRAQVENAQREAAELASVYHAAPAGLAVLDTQFRFVHVNERMAEMDGIPVAEHTGKPLRKLLPHVAGAAEAHLNRVLESAKPLPPVPICVRTPAHPRNDRHWILCAQPLKDEHGHVMRMEWSVEDVTDRHAAEVSMRENEMALRTIVDNLPAPLCVKDTQGRYVYANRAYERFTQVDAATLRGKMDHEAFPWEAADKLRENDEEAAAASGPVRVHGSARFKEALCHYDGAKTALRDKDNNVYGVCAMYSDLTDRVRAESDLEAAEARYRAIFESSPQPVMIDRDNALVYVNAACVRLLAAQDAQQLLGKSILEFIDRSGHKAFHERIQLAFRRKAPEHPLETRFTRLDGAELAIELQAALYETAAERAVQIVARDVTEQRKAEEALRRSEARFRSAAEETPALIRIADASGGCVYWNRQWQRYTGTAAEKALGLAWTASVHADDRDRVVHALANAKHQRDALHLEYRLRDRENRYRWVLDVATPRLDDAGAWLGYVACIIDISERKRAEEALRQSVERFKSISERAPALLWLDTARSCEYVNLPFREFLGAHSIGGTGTDWPDRIHPDDRDRYVQARRAAEERLAPCEFELRLQRADGEYRRMHLQATPRLATDGTLDGYVGTLTDITDLRRTEQALQEADQRRNAFLAALAEELKAPIAPINAAAEALRTSAADVRARRASDIIVRQSQHLARVLEDAQDFSRLLEDRIELAPERTEFGSLVYRAIEAARPLIEARRHDLGVQMDAGRSLLRADPARLAQAITAVLTYCARSIPEGGRISVATEEGDDGVVLRIRDNGPGHASGTFPELFELFPARDTERSSAGLSLPLAHHLVELHEGSLEAMSEGPGKGTEFVLRIPGLHAGPADEARAGNNGTQRVLVVDDDSDSADSLSLALQSRGHVTRVASRSAAVPAAREFRPGVVLVDIAGMDGEREQLARDLRSLPETEHAVLLALHDSAAVSANDAADVPFDGYLVKPVEGEALQRILAESAGTVH